MSNPLSVRRVKVQTIDEEGKSVGKPSFGVMAADGYWQMYNDTFETLEELNDEINRTGCILDIVDHNGLLPADPAKIGTKNFYGDNWEKDG